MVKHTNHFGRRVSRPAEPAMPFTHLHEVSWEDAAGHAPSSEAEMTPAEPLHLVVIGSSAGGIEALGEVLAGVPKDFPAPIVIAQHIDPDRPSHLAQILSRRSSLPVETITGREELRPGIAFVVPANRHVEISDHDVTLREDGSGGPKPSVNLLFRSAAAAFGENLIAVILSGTGTDGADGAHSVKQQGGTVIIQNPDTASYPGMPESLSPATVDIVANVERIGPLLNDLLTGKYVPTRPENDSQLQALLEALRDRSGIDFSTYKLPTIGRRLQRRMAATDNRTLADYSAYLETHPDEYHRLVSSFLIKVTEFFRDPELFGYLRDRVLPSIIEQARKTDREIRIWSAGCSTGEEAYSLAILLCESLASDIDQFRVRIFATDADEDAVNFARRGVYPASALAGLARDIVSRYFIEEDGEYAVRKHVRSLVIFGQHDLGQRPPFPRTDLVLCRNVLIYFTVELQKRALQLFAFSLRDEGYLVLGKAETITPLAEYFVADNFQLKVFRRHGPHLFVPPMPMKAVPAVGATTRRRRRVPGTTERNLAEAAATETARRAMLERFDAIFLNLPVGLVVIDRSYDVQHINTEARHLLGIYGAAIGEDFVHLADRLSSRELRSAIDRAFRDHQVTTLTEMRIVNTDPPAGQRYLDLTCSPHPAADSEPELLSILVADVTARVLERDQGIASMAEQRQQFEGEIHKLEESTANLSTQVTLLTEANNELRRANEQLTAVNMELRMANEEALISTEEAQAASEEVETLNEELQASNEELETLNEELQATVEELNTTNEELTSRSAQLQEMAATRDDQRRAAEQARVRLEGVFAAIPAAIAIISRDGQPALTNAGYAELFGSPTADFHPEDRDGRPLRGDDSPQARAARGEEFDMEFGMTSEGRQRWFRASGRPLPTQPDGQPSGGLILIHEVRNGPVPGDGG